MIGVTIRECYLAWKRNMKKLIALMLVLLILLADCTWVVWERGLFESGLLMTTQLH